MFHVDGQINTRRRLVDFRSFANAPKCMSIRSFDEFRTGETLPSFESDFQFSLGNGSRAAFKVSRQTPCDGPIPRSRIPSKIAATLKPVGRVLQWSVGP
jgi:hypothetical protein